MSDTQTLREAEYFRQQVAVDIEIALYNKAGVTLTDEQGEAAADAAIATMFERLRTPSEGLIEAGSFEVFAGSRSAAEGDAKNAWVAMLDAFQQENSDG